MTTAKAVYQGTYIRHDHYRTQALLLDTIVGKATDVDIDHCMLMFSTRTPRPEGNVCSWQGQLATVDGNVVIEWENGFPNVSQATHIEWSVTEFEGTSLDQNVQRGTNDNTSDTTDITITSTVLDQTLFLNSYRTAISNFGPGGNEVGFEISYPAATTIRFFYGGTAPETNDSHVAWQAIEFASTEVHVQHGVTDFTNSGTDTLTGFTTQANMAFLKTGIMDGASSVTNNRGWARGEIDSTSQVSFDAYSVVTSTETHFSWSVIEFIGTTKPTVHTGLANMANGTTETTASFTAVNVDFACPLIGSGTVPNSYNDASADDGVNDDMRCTISLDDDGAGIVIKREDSQSPVEIGWTVIEWVNGDGPSGVSIVDVIEYIPTGAVTNITIPVKVSPSASLMTLSIGLPADKDVTTAPQWNAAENFTLPTSGQTTSSGVATDHHAWTYGLVSPTSKEADVTLTIDSEADITICIVVWTRTETSSVAAAMEFISEDVNDTGTNTSVHASAGDTGEAGYFYGTFYGADGEPATINNSFTIISNLDSVVGGSGNSQLVAVKLGGLPTAVTGTWAATDENASQYWQINAASSGAQDLTPGLHSEVNIFNAPAVTVGAVALTPGLHSETNIFLVPVVAAGAVGLTPGLHSETNIFYSPTVSGGGASLSPSLHSEVNIFYVPVLTVGAVGLTPGIHNEANSFFVPVVAVGAVGLSPSLFEEVNIIYTATVVGAQGITAGLHSETNIFLTQLVGDAPEFSGFNVYYGGGEHALSLIAEEFAPSGFGGIMKMKINDTIYAVQLVEVGSANASLVKVRTADGVKAIKLKS